MLLLMKKKLKPVLPAIELLATVIIHFDFSKIFAFVVNDPSS